MQRPLDVIGDRVAYEISHTTDMIVVGRTRTQSITQTFTHPFTLTGTKTFTPVNILTAQCSQWLVTLAYSVLTCLIVLAMD